MNVNARGQRKTVSAEEHLWMHNISNFEIDELQQQKIIRLQFACNHQNWKNLARSDECNFSFEVHMARSQSGTNSMKK